MTLQQKLAEARAELSAVREKISKYELGDRPPSPPVRLLVEERRLLGIVAHLKAGVGQRELDVDDQEDGGAAK